jgi:hypothetical protein
MAPCYNRGYFSSSGTLFIIVVQGMPWTYHTSHLSTFSASSPANNNGTKKMMYIGCGLYKILWWFVKTQTTGTNKYRVHRPCWCYRQQESMQKIVNCSKALVGVITNKSI